MKEMTWEEYTRKYSLFTLDERMEYRLREAMLVRTNPIAAVQLWKDKKEIFMRRLMDKLRA